MTRRLTSEGIGSAFLAMIVVGSGIAAQRLSPGNVGLQLFENATATATGLYVLIVLWAPISGAHFNPLVSAVSAFFGGLSWRHAFSYTGAQVAGCIGGAMLANLMFGGAAVSISTTHRSSAAHWLAEVVATIGLLLVIFGLARTGQGNQGNQGNQGANVAAAVGAYIGAAYFFTSSTSFANPAIVVGRMFSDTFAGIAPAAAPGYVVAECIGAVLAAGLIKTLFPSQEILHASQRNGGPTHE